MRAYDLEVTGSLKVLGDINAENYILNTSVTTMTQSFASGSTIFGDSTDDTHQFSGSVLMSGSLSLNNYEVTEISNDTSLGDGSATALVTENAVKSFVTDQVINPNTYLRKQFFKTSNSISIPSTASFTAVTASAPTGLTSTSKNDFVFFINGQYMEHDAISIQQAGASLLLKVNNDSIGYDLETDDEILAIGKFNS